MSVRQIPIVSHEEFKELASRDPKLLHTNPWIVEGYIREWPAFEKWQNFDNLRATFGDLEAFAKAPNFITHRKSSLVSVKTRFDQYLDYIEEPERAEQIYEDCWLEGGFEEYTRLGMPLYCGTLRMVHKADDPLFGQVDPLLPEPLKSWNHILPYYYTLFNHLWLLVSLPGALTPLHTDNNGTIALIAQLRGKKRATLYSPEDLEHVRMAAGDFYDPRRPDNSEFPTASLATQWEGDIEEGQVLFVGTNWAHHVETLETSVSVSFDFVDETNLALYARSTAWAAAFGQRLKRKPDLVIERMKGLFTHTSLSEFDDVTVGRLAMDKVIRQSLDRQPDDEAQSILRTYSSELLSTLEPAGMVHTA